MAEKPLARVRPIYRVGTAAREAGVGVQTLHYYERRGLVKPRGRTGGGYREYGEAEVGRVRAIKRAQALGFTLGEIRELIAIADARRPSRRVGDLARTKLSQIDARIRDLRRMRRELRRAVEACDCRGDLTRCGVLKGIASPEPTKSAPSDGRRKT